jgi:anti-anti-sigma regulatory factor
MQAVQVPKILHFSGSLGVERASALKDELAAALEGDSAVLLNLSSIEDIDLSCLQVLHAAKASAMALGKELHFTGSLHSGVVSRLLSCGFLRRGSERSEDLESALGGE